MHHLACTYDLATKGLTDALVAKANTKQWNFASKVLHHGQRNSSFVWCTGTRREHNALGLQCLYVFNADRIIAIHRDIRP